MKKVIKGEEHATEEATMKIVEPIALKNNKVYDLDSYPYKTSLKKGQVVTLFLEQMASGDYSIKLGGNAQINSKLESSYSALLDLYLHSSPKVADLIGTLNVAPMIEISKDVVNFLDLTTPNKTYKLSYVELPESNQLFVSINSVGYITSSDKSFE